MAITRFNLPFADVGSGIRPADGALLFFFKAGTSDPKDTFSDEFGVTPNSNPVVANSVGVFSDIWLDGSYKVVLEDKNNVQQWEADPVRSELLDVEISQTITELRAITGALAQTVVKVLGHTTIGDGGAGDFYFDGASSQTDDDGTIIQPDEGGVGRWIRIFNGDVDVRWFGAVNDSVTDSILQIQAAVDNYLNVTVGDDGGFFISASIILSDGHKLRGRAKILFGNIQAIEAFGSVSQEVDMTVAVTEFVSEITVTDGSLFSEGEIIRLVSSINSLSEDAGDFRLGEPTSDQISYFTEYAFVHGITGDVLSLLNPTNFDNYPLVPGASTPTDRQISVVQKLNTVKVDISDISFERTEDGPGLRAIRLQFNLNSTVRNINIDSKIFIGTTIFLQNCYGCAVEGVVHFLDADTDIDFDGNNPGGKAFFDFNAIKFVGCHSCHVRDVRIHNNTQAIDFTFLDAPNIGCTMEDNKIYKPRVNMLTTHSGSFNCSMINNVGIDCERGISARSRGDRLIGNQIISGRNNLAGLTTDTSTYGIAQTEGWCQSTVIQGNYIEGFRRAIFVQNTSGSILLDDLTIMDNVIAYCRQGITLQRSPSNPDQVRTVDCGTKILSNTFLSCSELTSISIEAAYIHGVLIDGNRFMADLETSTDFVISVQSDNLRTIVINNTFPNVGRAMEQAPIIDTVNLGANTLANIGFVQHSNRKVNGSDQNVWLFDGGFLPDGGVTPDHDSRDFISLTSAITTLEAHQFNTMDMNNSSGGDLVIDTISDGIQGQDLYLVAASIVAGNRISLVDTGNIDLISSPTLIDNNRFLHLKKRSSTGNWVVVGQP